jgi:Xaa-Pro aminopeptidase
MNNESLFMNLSPESDGALCDARRRDLLERIRKRYPAVKQGAVLLIAHYEQEQVPFQQESSFYYLTGISEPAVAMLIMLDGSVTLFIPAFDRNRSVWVKDELEAIKKNLVDYGIDRIVTLGEPVSGYQMGIWAPQQAYANLIQEVKSVVEQKGTLFTLSPATMNGYEQQRFLLERLKGWIGGLESALTDISPIIARMRRIKDMTEIELLAQAAEITCLAQQAAAQVIEHDLSECEVQGQIEYMMIASGLETSFQTVVASGPESTTLHYTKNCRSMQDGELVLIDCGAMYEHYCADISRTYPVSRTFSDRQREVYDIVLETQEYIADIAKPGYFLNNVNEPQKSLNHLAREFLKKKGYEQYCVHGIGHFLGLDVHDVGDSSEPLEEGDIITIEPGIYIPEEQLGIRIEDNYWMTKKGLICLSESLPKKAEDIEAMMQGTLQTEEEECCSLPSDEHECGCDDCDDCYDEH